MLQSYSLMDALAEIKSLEFSGSEIWHEHLAEAPPPVSVLKAFPLEYTFHAPSWDINPCSRIRAIREFAQAYLIRSLDFAAAIECRMVTFHPGYKSNPKNDYSMYEDILHDFLDLISERSAELGLPLAMEVMDATPNQLVNTPRTANELTALFPGLGICFDVAHGGRFSDPIIQLRQLEKVIHLHLSNATPEMPHAALDQGQIDIKSILEYVQLNYPDIIIAVEGFDPSGELELLRRNRSYLGSINFWPQT